VKVATADTCEGLGFLTAEVRRIGLEAGLDAVGVAPASPFFGTRRHLEERKAEGLHGEMQFTYRNPGRSTDPSRILPGARALVVGARRYLRSPPVTRSAGRPSGRVARYAWSDHYASLRSALGSAATFLEAGGYEARVVADDNAMVDREAAYRAGLGWYGKNSNLLLGGRGSWFVLGAVVTDAALVPARPMQDGCGPCTRCMPACPTNAIVAPGILDARRCLAWLVQAPGIFPRELREALEDRLYGCDACQEPCPVNLVDERRAPAQPSPRDAEAEVDVLDLLAASDEELMRRFGRWYIAERDPRHLRRNALIVLGNTGSGSDREVAAALEVALGSPDPLIRAHAVWAALRLGRRDLAARLEGDPDPIVRAELVAAESVEVRVT
jgi:epoxyqueuosine reductase